MGLECWRPAYKQWAPCEPTWKAYWIRSGNRLISKGHEMTRPPDEELKKLDCSQAKEGRWKTTHYPEGGSWTEWVLDG